jgi:hypothetical protein
MPSETMPKKEVLSTGYHAVLGVPDNASPAHIKKAYRQLALKIHPDKNPNDPNAAENFQKIKEAYDALLHGETISNFEHDAHKEDNQTQPSAKSSDSSHRESTSESQESRYHFEEFSKADQIYFEDLMSIQSLSPQEILVLQDVWRKNHAQILSPNPLSFADLDMIYPASTFIKSIELNIVALVNAANELYRWLLRPENTGLEYDLQTKLGFISHWRLHAKDSPFYVLKQREEVLVQALTVKALLVHGDISIPS